MNIVKQMYRSSPKVITLPIDFMYGITPNSIKYGKRYNELKKFLDQSQWWSKEQHVAFQVKEMKKLLIHSFEHVPYYNKIFKEVGFDPYQFKYLEQIEVLPLLNKTIIQENFNELQADNFPKYRKMINTTGGTTGNQLKFYTEKNYNQKEWPFVELIWGRVGYDNKSRVASLRNHIFKDEEIYRYDWKEKRLVLDNFKLSDENIKMMLDRLSKDRIEYIHTYPSAIVEICDYIRRSGYHNDYSLKAILATSENIYPGQKELIEETLNCRLFTFYGHTERACIAGWCEESDLYHVQTEYGYMELLDENNNVILEADKRGEIICTGFNNYAMPFIRYQTADYSSYAKDGMCGCKRNYKLLNNIEGRWTQEMLLSKDGSKISITALNMHSDIFKNIKQYQLYQDTIGKCIIKIIKTEQYSIYDEENIKKEFYNKMGSSIDIEIKYVEKLEKTQRGKTKYLIQKIKL